MEVKVADVRAALAQLKANPAISRSAIGVTGFFSEYLKADTP